MGPDCGTRRPRRRLRWVAAVWLLVQVAAGSSVLGHHDDPCFSPPVTAGAHATALTAACTCHLSGSHDPAALVSIFSFPGIPVLTPAAMPAPDRASRTGTPAHALRDHYQPIESPPPRIASNGQTASLQ
jgi:hypothetical protein